MNLNKKCQISKLKKLQPWECPASRVSVRHQWSPPRTLRSNSCSPQRQTLQPWHSWSSIHNYCVCVSGFTQWLSSCLRVCFHEFLIITFTLFEHSGWCDATPLRKLITLTPPTPPPFRCMSRVHCVFLPLCMWLTIKESEAVTCKNVTHTVVRFVTLSALCVRKQTPKHDWGQKNM